MGTYTDFFEDASVNLYYDAENLIEELKKMVPVFRSFDQALDTLLVAQGYDADLDNTESKLLFIKGKFMKAEVPVPRNMKKWYTTHKFISRNTAFQICFAFQLSIPEALDFLRRICLFRGFDCHSREELIIFFALKQGLTYLETQKYMEEVKVVKQGRIHTDNLVYTDVLVREIEKMKTLEEIMEYVSTNESYFLYNNVRACKAICQLWDDIAKEQGIAVKEKRQLYVSFDKEKEMTETEIDVPKRKERKREEKSIWEIYLQILGLSGNHVSQYYQDRSIKSLLTENELLHPFAEASFPDRDGLTKVLLGEHLSYERVRKIMILLVFYRFWAKKALQLQSYEAGYLDADRCRCEINHFLVEAGYPLLYAGNPYDFIFLYANNSDVPLLVFREYMQDIFYMKNQQVESNDIE